MSSSPQTAPSDQGQWLDTPLDERTVVHVLRRGAENHGSRTALVDKGGSETYASLLHRSQVTAGALRRLGVGSQDSVLIMMDNHIDHVLAWFGTNFAGGVEVPVNTALRGNQLAYVTNHSEARTVIVDEAYAERFMQLADDLTGVENIIVRGDASAVRDFDANVIGFDDLRDADPVSPPDLKPWDVLGIMYTSGTTGRSKGVIVTQAQTYGRMLPLRSGSPEAGDVSLVTLPIYHVIGQCRGLYNTLIAQGTAILEERFSASGFWDTCREHDVTYVPLVGAMASYLLSQPASDRDREHAVERMCVGTTIPEIDEFAQRFGVDVTTSYGLTEVGGVLIGPARAQGCGYIRPDYEAALVDEHDQAVATGETGELVLRGREPWTVMGGYLKNAEETVAKWRNLWLHTGDLMYQRPDGEFVFVGRRTESIRRKGENVSPMEAEEGVTSHPAVEEAAVVGIDVDDEVELKAVITVSDGVELDLEELVEHLVEVLPYYMVPRFYHVVDELPRTESTLRVQKAGLREAGTEGAWDREAHGLMVVRDGLRRVTTDT